MLTVKASTDGADLGGICPKLHKTQRTRLALWERWVRREVGVSERHSREERPKQAYVVNGMD